MIRRFGTARLVTHYTFRQTYFKKLANRQHREIPLWRRTLTHLYKRDKRYFAFLWMKKRRLESREKKKEKYREQFLGQQIFVDRASTHFTSPELQQSTRAELFRIFMEWEETTEKGIPRSVLLQSLKRMGESYSTAKEDAFLLRSSYTQMANKMRGSMKYREYIEQVTRVIKRSEMSQLDFMKQFEKVLTEEKEKLEEEVQKKTRIVKKDQDERIIRALNMEDTPLNFSYE